MKSDSPDDGDNEGDLVGPVGDSESFTRPVTKEGAPIVLHLAKLHPRLQNNREIRAGALVRGVRLDKDTISQAIKALIKDGHVHRPHGPRKGTGLTPQGLTLAAQLRRKIG